MPPRARDAPDDLLPPAKKAAGASTSTEFNAAASSSATSGSSATLESELVAALQTGSEAFVAPPDEGDEPLQEAMLLEAISIARKNSNLQILGIDGTDGPLGVAASTALGSLSVSKLKCVGLSFAGSDAVAAFALAAASNRTLTTLGIFETDADGSWAFFDPETSSFAAELQRARAGSKLPPLTIEQIAEHEVGGEEVADGEEAVADEHDNEEEAEDEEHDDGEDEDEDEEYVECDGRSGKGRDATRCGKQLVGEEAVFTSAFGRDYCAECYAKLGRDGFRKATAAQRIEEATSEAAA